MNHTPPKPPIRSAWEKRVHRLVDRLREIAATVKESDEYGTNAADDGLWCEDCAPKHAYNLNSGGHNEEDGQRFCDKCLRILDHSFTDEGCREEIHTSAENTVPIDAEEAYILMRVIGCGNPFVTCRCGDFVLYPDLKPQLRKIMARLKAGAK